jgi:class 3 adenylate cyclase/tetratricopeptide (TPR) repeat protein
MSTRGATRGSGPVTVTILFTDTVSSTELLGRLGLDAATDLQRIHDRLLATAVGTSGGRYVKSTGDGIMATFNSAQDAVTAAVAVQRAVDAHARRAPATAFGIRVGLSAGDVVWNDDGSDCIGTAVIEAARLCDAAAQGEILVSDVIRVLARDASVTFEPAGEFNLKGFSQPLQASRVLWSPGTASLLPLPAPLRIADAPPYVGRGDVLSSLRRAWDDTRSGGCRCVLLAGEPGVGKTRTTAQLVAEVVADGPLVLYGGCEEGIGTAYQPFAEALDLHTTHMRDPDLGLLPGELRRLLPDLEERVGRLPAPLTSDPRTEEFRLFEAIGSWLSSASVASGLVLVLDDLHWASKPTLLALGHLVDAVADERTARLLVLCTYRDSDVDRSHPLGALLARWASHRSVDRHVLSGLSAEEVALLVRESAGQSADERVTALARRVHAETEGNPFFVGEVLRHLVESGAVRSDGDTWVVDEGTDISVPPNVRDVVQRRLGCLTDDTQTMLSSAAVLGRDFDLPTLAGLLERPEDELVDGLEHAVAARLLDEIGADLFRFSHGLVQETLYDEMSATRRRRLHRRVIGVFEQVWPDDVVALAHHFMQAGVEAADRPKAAQYLVAAARLAQESRALADAEARYRQALEVAGDSPELHSLVIDAAIGLGECQRDQGDPAYHETLVAAAERAGDDTQRLVAAVLANRRGITSVVGEVDHERVTWAERALAQIAAERTEDRARLLAYLATEIVFTGQTERRRALVDEAESIARELDDKRVLAEVLVRTAFPAIALDRIDALVIRGGEGVELADAVSDPALQAEARSLWAWALLTAGDLRTAERVNREAAAIAAEAGSSSLQWMTRYWQVAHLGAAGRFDEAAALNDELLGVAQAGGEPDGLNWWGAASTALALLRGTVGELADVIGAYADQYPALPTWRAAHLQALGEAGRLGDVRATLAAHPIDIDVLVGDPYALPGLMSLSEVSWLIGDAALAARVLAVVEPHAKRWGHLFIGVSGPMSWAVGRCLLALGRADEAVGALQAAVADAEAQGCAGVATRIRADLSAVARPQTADPE